MLTVFIQIFKQGLYFIYKSAYIHICKEIGMSHVFWDSLYILVMNARALQLL